MKNILIIFCSIMLCSNIFAQPVAIHGALKVVGTKLTDEHDSAVALHGVSLGWHCFHPQYYTAGAVQTLHKDFNCSVVRAAMGVEPDGGYIQNRPDGLKKVTTIVDAAIEEGIYVIIDWHSHNIQLQEAKTFFQLMAMRYGQYPNVIYEIFNEPDYETWPEVKKYSQEIINVIRSVDPDNIILVGNTKWDQEVTIAAKDPIKDETNLMYTLHFYAATHKDYLRNRADSAIAMGLPIFVSESAGMEATGDGKLDYKEWQTWRDWMDGHNLSYVVWSLSNKNESCSMLYESASPNGGWKDKDIKESGLKTREILRGYKIE